MKRPNRDGHGQSIRLQASALEHCNCIPSFGGLEASLVSKRADPACVVGATALESYRRLERQSSEERNVNSAAS